MQWADAVPNLLIGAREGLEAGLVVSILLAALGKPRRASSVPIWFGVGAAVVLALSFGAGRTLDIVVEKDFACLDKNGGENVDTFANPHPAANCQVG